MIRRPPRSTRTDTLFPYTTLFRSLLDSVGALVPWLNLESIVNTNGQLITSGFLYDQPADGFAGFSFNVLTYPGLKAMADRSFDTFRDQMAASFPSLDSLIEGGEGGLETWRSEERRVGKECVRTGRSGWVP